MFFGSPEDVGKFYLFNDSFLLTARERTEENWFDRIYLSRAARRQRELIPPKEVFVHFGELEKDIFRNVSGCIL